MAQLGPAPVASPASRWCWSPRLLWPNPSRGESPNSSLFMAKSWSIRGKSVSSLMFFYRESCFSSGMMKCGGSSSMNETVKIHQDHPLSNIGDQIYDGNHNYSDNPCIIERGACFSLLRITNLQLDSKWVKHQHRTTEIFIWSNVITIQ